MKWLIRFSLGFNILALFYNLGSLVSRANNSEPVWLPLFWLCLNIGCIILLGVVIPRIDAKTKRLREAEDQRREKLIAEYSSYMPDKAWETMLLRSYQR